MDKETLKMLANKLMFTMDESEYDTLNEEFDTILKQMDLIGNIESIESIEPMTFPFELDSVELRNDEDSRNIDIEDALSNTGSKKGREIRVPKVVD